MNAKISEEIREYVHEKTTAFDLDAIHRTGQRRRRVRTSAITAGVVAAAILATGTAVSLSQPASLVPLSGESVHLVKGMKTVAMVPLNSRISYAVVQTAPKKYAIARTTDGGSDWQAWALPTDSQNDSMTRFGGQHANSVSPTLTDQDEPLILGSSTLTIGGFLSRNGGQSWTKITGGRQTHDSRLPVRVVGSDITSIPASWPLGIGQDRMLSAVDPATGLWHRLATQPKPGLAIGSGQRGSDGTIWAGYQDPKLGLDKASGVAVSHNSGRSWTTYTIDPADGAVMGPTSTDANHAYAPVYRDHPGSGSVDPVGLLTTSDGGQTWHRQQASQLPASAVTLPDGSLLGWSPTPPLRLVISKDGGKTATPVPGTEKAFRFGKTVDGLFVFCDSLETPSSYRVSTDGRHWTPIPLPSLTG
jgi:hypothetical protein